MRFLLFLTLSLLTFGTFSNSMAENARLADKFKEWRETHKHRQEGKDLISSAPKDGVVIDNFEGRDVLVHIPPNLQPESNRAIIIAMHGGMGNANHIRGTLNMEDTADKYGFIIAYPNGTRASKLNDKFKAWNGGGGCCGQPFTKNIDDVGYITRLSAYLVKKYSINSNNVFGMGHSNGAILSQRIICESDAFAAIIPISGPLNIDVQSCPPAKGKRILSIHGLDDKNVPIGGGYGTRGIGNVKFQSEEHVKNTFEQSGADYTLLALEKTDHSLKNIMAAILKEENITIGEKAAEFFKINKPIE